MKTLNLNAYKPSRLNDGWMYRKTSKSIIGINQSLNKTKEMLFTDLTALRKEWNRLTGSNHYGRPCERKRTTCYAGSII